MSFNTPSNQHVWVPGQWERTPDSWSWTAGNWVQPPFSNAYWVPGYWKHHGGRYAWQPAPTGELLSRDSRRYYGMTPTNIGAARFYGVSR